MSARNARPCGGGACPPSGTFLALCRKAHRLLWRAQLYMAKQRGSEEKVRVYLWRGAEAYDRCGHLESAEEQLDDLLECELSKEQKLEALCFLADVQARGRGGGGRAGGALGGAGRGPGARTAEQGGAAGDPHLLLTCGRVAAVWWFQAGGSGGEFGGGSSRVSRAADAPAPASTARGASAGARSAAGGPDRFTPGPLRWGAHVDVACDALCLLSKKLDHTYGRP